MLSGQAAAMTGRQIMDEVSRRQKRDQEFAQERMTLTDGKEIEAVRTMRRYLRRGANGLFRYLIVYDTPAGIAGTAALTWEVADGPDDQWLYLPALGRLTRIIGGAKRKSFMGTDFSFEDLTVEDENEFEYTRLPDRNIDGKPHYVVRAVPMGADVRETTAYAAREISVQADVFLVTRIDYFGKLGAMPIKTLSVLKAKPIDRDTWRATEYLMTSHAEDHSTRVETLNTSFDAAATPAEFFEQRYLTSRAHMR